MKDVQVMYVCTCIRHTQKGINDMMSKMLCQAVEAIDDERTTSQKNTNESESHQNTLMKCTCRIHRYIVLPGEFQR